jgi:hypothetical protein
MKLGALVSVLFLLAQSSPEDTKHLSACAKK